MRAGGYILNLLTTPRVLPILESLAEGEKGRQELRRPAGFSAQSTLRSRLNSLERAGVLSKRGPEGFPGGFKHRLTGAGRDLFAMVGALTAWLAEGPQGPLAPDSDHGRAAVKGLIDGWLADMLTPLSEGPLSLTELDKQLSTVSYPTLERWLETMRLAGLVQEGCRRDGGTPYAPTDWLRRGIAPLATAIRWEHCYGPEEAEPITRRELESAFDIAGPLLAISSRYSGICQLAVRAPATEKRKRALGVVEVRSGRISFGPGYPRRKPDAWVSGDPDGWFETLIDGEQGNLRLSGDRKLAMAIFDEIHDILAVRTPATTLQSKKS